MIDVKYVIYKEDKFYIAKCLNIELSSFGESIDEAKKNIEEAIELYFEDEEITMPISEIESVLIGDYKINA